MYMKFAHIKFLFCELQIGARVRLNNLLIANALLIAKAAT